ncbi:signal peptidase II [Thalassotalea marina]|uniref:Lipoprotein signal peptidase n=1 Tax=Thalassotalea marina TaxID=1673741 RepID=A0A919ENK6_9GAMM|nr:signal peptidase II [Thalassotalea marina]GHG02503.1 lipoprotein signal peptidase [Thalassotalea marina]
MSLSKSSSSLHWLWITLLFLVIDQVSKHWVAGSMELYQSIEVFSFFNITYAHNPGAAFSFLADQGGWQRWFFTGVAIIASVVFLVWLKRTPKENYMLGAALACMLSGALGNLIDRLLFGYVIDFLDFHWQGNAWPTFNIADSIIFIGAALMIIDSFQQEKAKKNSAEV